MKSTEESTKIHSASELDEMVRRAKSEPALNEFDDDEHTMIGNSQELAERSMKVPDEAPAPRASSNIIRRTGPVMVVRAASEPAPVPALGIQTEVVQELDVDELDVDEDAAFAPWDGMGQRTSPQSANELVAALEEVVPKSLPDVAVPSSIATARVDGVVRAPVEAPQPRVEARVPAPIVMVPPVDIASQGRLRIDRIVAIAVAVVLIVVIAFGYRRISALEDEL
ncbi:MAG: hypothetical protein H0V17_17810, partial [Deltaproteobacteria bacterium]|nr:hypothetical protein [Deltaproteobacteria bacterium]